MKNGWQTKKLGDLYDITSSKRVFKSDWRKSGVPFYRAREIVKLADQGFVDNELFISEEMFDQYAEKYGIHKEGDIMVTGVGTLGVCYVVRQNDRFYFKDGNIIWLKNKDSERTNSRFVEYAFQSDLLRKQIDDSVGATVGTYTIIKAKNTLISIPEPEEQRRIVGILDEAFDGIATAKANAEKNLQNARALFENLLNAVFTQRGDGWVEKRLDEIAKVFGRGKSRHRPRNEPSLYGGDYPFIQTGDVRNASLTIESYAQTYSELGLAQSKLWPSGTVCITIAANIAETAILGFDGCIPDSIIGLVVDDKKAINKFVLYLLMSFKAHLQAQGKGSAQDNINMGTFENQHFPFPSLRIQAETVAILDSLAEATQRLESIYQRKLDALDELKKSLLHQVFSGQL